MKIFLIYFLLLGLLFSCTKEPNLDVEPIQEPPEVPEPPDSNYVGFNMYFLKDDEITAQDLYDADLYTLELEDHPFLTQSDIEIYDTSIHALHLYNSMELPEMVWVLGKPFVVLTDTIRHYYGALWPMYSSSSFYGYVIDVYPRFYPNDIVKISRHFQFKGSDNRMNRTITDVLTNYEVLHQGISFVIDTIELIDNDSTLNRCKVKFKYTITNNDDINLYVFDPLKMPEGLFNWFHNGIYFRGNSKIYKNTSGGIAPAVGTSEIDWLIKIKNKQSITRIIEKSGYRYIPKGKYECGFRFSSPIRIAKSKRVQPDGRVWIGDLPVTDSIIVQ